MKTSTHTIAILGAGRMGAPMARRLAGAGYDVCLSARDMARLKAAAGDEPRIRLTTDTAAAVSGARLVIVAVPPAATAAVLDAAAPALAVGAVVATLSPAMSLAEVQSHLPAGTFAARLMPNTALRLGASMTFAAFAADVPADSRAMLVADMEVMGQVTVIEERLIGAATALCSCGIAYAMRYVRAAAEGAVQMGFDPAVATRAIAATLSGAAAILMQEPTPHPEAEIDRVTTPGGTTIRGLNAMEAAGFTPAVIAGLIASSHE